jgi:hypothetical protein
MDCPLSLNNAETAAFHPAQRRENRSLGLFGQPIPATTAVSRALSFRSAQHPTMPSPSRLISGRRTRHVVCVSNEGYDASLERRKIYVAFIDRQADELGMVRVVDESGEDYLYPKAFFAEIRVSLHLAKALASAK